MRIAALLLFFLLMPLQPLSAMNKGETAWFDTLPEWQKKLMKKGLWYSLTPHGSEPLDPAIFLLPFLKELKEKGLQAEKDAELRSCMSSVHLEWPIERLLIAGCVFAGANPNIKDEYSNPLIRACQQQDFALMQFLCDHQADVTLADECHHQKMILYDVSKYKIAAYLAMRGAELKKETNMGANLLHNSIVMNARGSSRLVQFYLDEGVSVSIGRVNVLHQLALLSATYDHDGIPKMLKKFNMIVTHLSPEKTLQLLQQRDTPFKLLPEEKCAQSRGHHAESSQFLAGIMRQKREVLEHVMANRHQCSSCS